MEAIAVAFWKRVNDLIKSQDKKQETVAQNCNISYQTFRGWITRKTFPDGLQTANIARELNTSVEYLVTGEQPKDSATERLKALKSIIEEAALKASKI